MRLKFEILIEGEESIKTKFEHAVLVNPRIGDGLVSAFLSSIMLAFDLRTEDKIKIVSFFGNLVETPEISNKITENSLKPKEIVE